MSNIQNLLNPLERRRSVKLILNTNDEHPPSDTPPSPTPSSMSEGSDQIEQASLPPTHKSPHLPHPDCPDTLNCLPDTDGRPQHTLPVILRCAILGSPKKRLTIREIYASMEAKYPYYRTAGPTWKQSVRHHLSLNRLFERQPRPVTEPGFGSYWTVNLSAPPGTKRPRKRGKPNKDGPDGTKVTRKRGRPRKNPSAPPMQQIIIEQPPAPPSRSLEEVEPEEDDEGKDLGEDEDDISHATEDELESEEGMEIIHPLDRRASLTGLTAYPDKQPTETCFEVAQPPPSLPVLPPPPAPPTVYPGSFPLPPFSSLGKNSDNVIDQLQMEIASLRKQTAEAVSVSLRLSDQASQAQSEAARARASLRAAETMLEEETRRRKEAEKVAEEETKKRRILEEALSTLLQKKQDA